MLTCPLVHARCRQAGQHVMQARTVFEDKNRLKKKPPPHTHTSCERDMAFVIGTAHKC